MFFSWFLFFGVNNKVKQFLRGAKKFPTEMVRIFFEASVFLIITHPRSSETG